MKKVPSAKKAPTRWRRKPVATMTPEEREARNAWQKSWYWRNRDRALARQRAYTETNKDRINADRRARRVRDRYGLSLSDVDALRAAQKGVCAICSHDLSIRRCVVDHCHESGRVRGLLCNQCNSALGFSGDSPATLRRMADYIEKNREEANGG